jgi:hypothetical protein
MTIIEFREEARKVDCSANYITAKVEAAWSKSGVLHFNEVKEYVEYQCYCDVHGHTKTYSTPEEALNEFQIIHGKPEVKGVDMEISPAFLRKIMD